MIEFPEADFSFENIKLQLYNTQIEYFLGNSLGDTCVPLLYSSGSGRHGVRDVDEFRVLLRIDHE